MIAGSGQSSPSTLHAPITHACTLRRHTCESVMRVLRSNRDSVMAMLEAFVHDPLINWRLLNTPDAAPDTATAQGAAPDLVPEDLPLLGVLTRSGVLNTRISI